MQAQSASEQLDRIVDQVIATRKYANISQDLIRNVAAIEIPKRRTQKEAVKATKNKLHQVAGVYLNPRIDYANILASLESADHEDALRQACINAMKLHSSTRERLGILDRFYSEILESLPSIRSVIDVGCGLNPLAIHWMGLASDAEYYAYDIYTDQADFLNKAFTLLNANGKAYARDVIKSPPSEQVDLALALKLLPCLEQVDKSASPNLLSALNAKYLLVSYPAQSLGGRSKGMSVNYQAHFMELISETNWQVQRFEFSTELAFLVTKYI